MLVRLIVGFKLAAQRFDFTRIFELIRLRPFLVEGRAREIQRVIRERRFGADLVEKIPDVKVAWDEPVPGERGRTVVPGGEVTAATIR
jgi:hypothetical protein